MEMPFHLEHLISFLKKMGSVASDFLGSTEETLRHNSKPHAGESVMHYSLASSFLSFTRNRLALIAASSFLFAGVAMGAGPRQAITVSLPTASLDNSVPISTIIPEPVSTTTIDAALNLVGFQGDFSFDETVITFATPPVQNAGLTAGNWNVSGNIIPGPGPIRTLRVSAFSNDFTPLSGSGTLYNLRMLRVSSTPGANSPLIWAADPNNFYFIDANLNTVIPSQTNGSITITGQGPSPTATATATATVPARATATATFTATATPTATATFTATASATATATATSTATASATATATAAVTPTATSTATATATGKPSATATATATSTTTPNVSATPTSTASATATSSATASATATATAPGTPTPTATGTPFPTPTPTFVGSFVIGDQNAVVGNHVTFWGAHWASTNSPSGGPAPHSFKGFARTTDPSPATCGGTWTTGPGNSASPPSSLPEFITVIAASSVTQAGSAISGDIVMIVTVQVDPGYQPNPGHPGTGTVVAVVCSATPLSNISTRLRVENADNMLVGGFIVTGTQEKKVLVRAIGPSLPMSDRLADPILDLHDSSGQTIATNDNWVDAPNVQAIIDSTIAPTNNLESAILMSLMPGVYTATVHGANNTTGVGLVEAYDLDRSANARLSNISTRGLVQTSDNVLIAGMIVLGEAPQKVILRAIGPSLEMSGKLADPILELRDGNGSLIRANDNWRSDQEAEIIATTIAPTSDLESAIVATLPANGSTYTAVVRGVNGTTGLAVVEVYSLN